ncbi:ester cyclase [Haladaptatus halobius]|uniref:ester cyclase n=1 Tax=Haladaptatus halobius TaxID=2884875 RepID=UPI001D0B8106|nr:ester cyclase [Haladaptatus halobius]
MATQATTLEMNKQLARRVPEDIATEGNLDLIDDLYTEDAIEHGPFGDEHGRATIRKSFEDFLATFADFSATVEDIIAEGNTVAMRVTLRGSQKGEFMGTEPTGQTFEVQNMVFTRIEDGMIVERWIQPDTLGLMQQLGVVESPTP